MPVGCASVLFVGEDNPQSSDPRHALYPYPPRCAGERLCNQILGLDTATYLACWRTNLCAGRWSKPQARVRAELLLNTYIGPWRVIVLLGAKVREAFSVADQEVIKIPVFFSAYSSAVRTLVSLPHPSGRNLVWNNPAAGESAHKLLRDLVPSLWES